MNEKYDIILGIPAENADCKSDIPCTKEDEALAIGFGAWLCGKKIKFFMQDSGWCNCINVITSLWHPYMEDNNLLDISVFTKIYPEHHLYTSTFFIDYKESLDNVFKKVRSYIYDNAKSNR